MSKKRKILISVTVTTMMVVAAMAFSLLMIFLYFDTSDHSQRAENLSWSEFEALIMDEWAPKGTDESKEKVGRYSNEEQIINIKIQGDTLLGFNSGGKMYSAKSPYGENIDPLMNTLRGWEEAAREAGFQPVLEY